MRTFNKDIVGLDAGEYKDNPAMGRTIPNGMKELTTVTEMDLLQEYYGITKKMKQKEDGHIEYLITQDIILNTVGLKEETICLVNYRPVTINTFNIIAEYLDIDEHSLKKQYYDLEIPRQEKIKAEAEAEAKKIQDEEDRIKAEEEAKILAEKRKEEQFEMMAQSMAQSMAMMQQLLLNNQQNNGTNNGGKIENGDTTVSSNIPAKKTGTKRKTRG